LRPELRPGELIAAHRGPVNVDEFYRMLAELERVALVAFRGSATPERRVYRLTPAGVDRWLAMGG
jgi:DNA-binding PadR family transcriptional regulator